MSFFKDNPYRSRKYLDWIKEQPCAVTGLPADDPHHIIGVMEGGTGTKACDLLCFPVTREEHDKFHRLDLHPELKDEQWKHVSKTLQKAIKEGFKF